MIEYDAARQAWTVTWGQTEWAIALEDGQLLAQHLGPAGRACPCAQPLHFVQPPVYTRGECAVWTGDGEQLSAWSLHAWSATETALCLALHAGDLRARLEYALRPEVDLIERRTYLSNAGGAPVRVRRATSCAVALPEPADYTFVHLDSIWGHECGVARTPVGQQETILQSRAGKTGYEHQPWFAIEGMDGTWIGSLLWSGNWEIRCRRGPQQPAALTGGLQPFALRHTLASGATLALPHAVFGYVAGDLNTAAQRLHDWQRAERPNSERPVPVQFNSWYPYPCEPDAAHVDRLIDDAARPAVRCLCWRAGGTRPRWSARTSGGGAVSATGS